MEKTRHRLGFFKRHRLTHLLAGWGIVALCACTPEAANENLLRPEYETQLQNLSLASILANGELTDYAQRSSVALFAEHCAACHGDHGVGQKTEEGLYAPILNDNDWLFEGRVETIHAAIADGSQGVMPAYRKKLSARELDAVSTYIKALSTGQGEQQPAGQKVFHNSGCTACHGEDAKGIPLLGAPNLTDDIWRFEDSLAGIKRTIAYGVNSGDPKDRATVMPQFAKNGKLTPTQIKKLAIYVYKLSAQSEQK